MTLRDCIKHPAIQELYELGIVSYVGYDEVFCSLKDLIYEILLRTSTSTMLSVKQEELDAEDFKDISIKLQQFCTKYNYDFSECCYDVDYFEKEYEEITMQELTNQLYAGGI